MVTIMMAAPVMAVTPAPHVTVTPHVTETPHITTPHVTETPHATETPHITETPPVTETPHITEKPNAAASPHTKVDASKYATINTPHPFYVPQDSSFEKSEVASNFFKGTNDAALRDTINNSSHPQYSTSQISELWLAYNSGKIHGVNTKICEYETEDKHCIIVILIIISAVLLLMLVCTLVSRKIRR